MIIGYLVRGEIKLCIFIVVELEEGKVQSNANINSVFA